MESIHVISIDDLCVFILELAYISVLALFVRSNIYFWERDHMESSALLSSYDKLFFLLPQWDLALSMDAQYMFYALFFLGNCRASAYPYPLLNNMVHFS